MTVRTPDVPQPDEIVMIFCVASRGRIGARVLLGLREVDVPTRFDG
jgi:hypothetical protein